MYEIYKCDLERIFYVNRVFSIRYFVACHFKIKCSNHDSGGGGHVFPQSHSRPMKGIVNIPEKERRRTMSFEAGAAAVFTALHGGISNDKNVCPSVCQTHEV